nr:MAG TPA: hypothetical protein [Caudoviricetes sp.]
MTIYNFHCSSHVGWLRDSQRTREHTIEPVSMEGCLSRQSKDKRRWVLAGGYVRRQQSPLSQVSGAVVRTCRKPVSQKCRKPG